ncbi:glycine betaine ABC transporter substrate-binding protein [Dethiobacter alkaliphilus]|uniref:glycine betaine ABC transporter substrate-binding protein n=1 Tax=Dethiobacter alkaliphilus TaxID=427926 RepID=UPI00222705A4|nr:glycine betaine ABC transporter substrate-binding protein [Dethiobacter alkaliphilus]MCW3488514.1 glycine/betaine ABC transporter substrate-binding protein [Dethiobacter alkaliphilus]
MNHTKSKVICIVLLALLLTFSLTGCNNNGGNGNEAATNDPVVIASKPHAEQYILGEMLAILLEENTDIPVTRNFGIAGGTSNLHPAMVSGEIDIYPEYTGTGWMFVLQRDLIGDSREMFEAVRDEYQDEFNITWLEPYGFNNTFTLAMPAALAEEYGLQTFSDLGEAAENFIFGAEFDFYERDDGFDALAETYNLNFKETREMDIGLKYQSIGAGEVDVINAFSTDGQISLFDLVILEDDRGFFPTYYAATMVRTDTLEKYPEIADALGVLEGQISDGEMTEMNYQVDKLNRDAADVAREFLESKGLL